MVGVCLSEIAASDFICCLICVIAKFFCICLIVRVFCAECNIFTLFLLPIKFNIVTMLHHIVFLMFVLLSSRNGQQRLFGENKGEKQLLIIYKHSTARS